MKPTAQSGQSQVWIGLAEVEQRPGAGLLLDRNKAFVNALAMAESEQAFRRAIDLLFDNAGFRVRSVQDAEPFSKRSSEFSVDKEILDLAKEVEATGSARFGTFYTWNSD